MNRRTHTRAALAVGALLTIVVAVPALLVRLANALLEGATPFSGMTAPWRWTAGQVGDALTSAIDQDTILTTLARVGLVAAWLAVVVLVINVAVEVWHQRSTGEPMTRVAGLGWSQGLAAKIAAGLLALSTSIPNHLAAAATLPARAPAAVLVASAPSAPTIEPSAPARAAMSEAWAPYRVANGDSLYGIAARLAGGDRARTRDLAQQILERNHGRQMSDGQRFTSAGYITEGWVLDLPAVETVTRVVEAGDCYWAIAEDELTDRLGHQPTDSEVYDYTKDLLDRNVARLGNRTPESLIHPGDIIILPSDAPLPDAAPTPSEGLQPTAEVPPPSTTPKAAPAATPPAAPVTTVTTTPPKAPASSAPSTTPAPTSARSQPVEAVPGHGSAPWRELAVGSLFATAITGTLALLRRRQLATRRALRPARPVAADAAIAEKILTLHAHADRINALAHLLPSIGIARHEPNDAVARAIQLDVDAIEILWSLPRPNPAAGWATANDGASWTHPYTETTETGRRPTVVLPTLVGVGTREGGELLIDLEATGSIAITGDPDLAEVLGRQLTWTLAATPLADTLDIRLVGTEPPAAMTTARLRSANLDDAARWAAARADELATAIRHTNAGSTFDARVRQPDGDWDPVVTIVNLRQVDPAAHPALGQLLEAAKPGSGIAVVLIGDHPAVRERIECQTATAAAWMPSGVPFTPHLLPVAASQALAALLDNAADLDAAVVNDEVAALSLLGVEAPTPSYDVLVCLIGEITVEGASAPLSEAETELLALLACLRPTGPVNIDRLATMLAHDDWRTPNLRTIKARVSDIRAKLGTGSDGKPLVPDARAGNNSPGRYTVSCQVLTDIDLLEASSRRAEHLSSSEAIELLTDALEILRGQPFCTRSGYEWADAEQQRLRAARAIVDATTRLVELATEAKDVATIQCAVAKAAGCINDPLGEFPVRRAEATAAVALGDPTLVRSALEYSQRLADAIDEIAGDFELDHDYRQALRRLKPTSGPSS